MANNSVNSSLSALHVRGKLINSISEGKKTPVRFQIIPLQGNTIIEDSGRRKYYVIDYTDLTREYVSGKRILKIYDKLCSEGRGDEINIELVEGVPLVVNRQIPMKDGIFNIRERQQHPDFKVLLTRAGKGYSNKIAYIQLSSGSNKLKINNKKLTFTRDITITAQSILAYYYVDNGMVCVGLYLSILDNFCLEVRLGAGYLHLYTPNGRLLVPNIRYEGLTRALVNKDSFDW